MKFVELTCQNCHAQLEMDLDKMLVYCPYCGKKLGVEIDDLSKVLLEREKTNRDKVKREYDIQEKKLDFEQKETSKIRDHKSTLIAAVFVWVIIGIIALVASSSLRSSERKHDAHIKELEQIEQQIDELILQEQYDEALLLANKLYATNGYSTDIETWDKKRETYIELINEKIDKQKRNDPETIFMPFASKDLVGRPYDEVAGQLRDLGFTNVTTRTSEEKPGVLTKNNSVEHLIIDGTNNFLKDDYFSKDVLIIVYYYSK